MQAKMKNSITAHRAHVHDIGVTWHDCPEPNCSYKAKGKSIIKVCTEPTCMASG